MKGGNKQRMKELSRRKNELMHMTRVTKILSTGLELLEISHSLSFLFLV